MEIKTYQENGMNIREIWINDVMEGREVFPILLETPIQSYTPTNSEIAQMISDLQAYLIIAGVI